ncbi:unnamed protein product [Chrysoparadoxa australica]
MSGNKAMNTGNKIGSRPVVRLSKLYRQHESGNAVKSLMGGGNLVWDINRLEGAFKGTKAYDSSQARDDMKQAPLGELAQARQYQSSLAPASGSLVKAEKRLVPKRTHKAVRSTRPW